MADENENWNETPNIFVAFLDIMGFRDRVYREKHEEVKKMLESLRPAISEIEQEAKERLKIGTKEITAENQNRYLVFPVSFSDSIILFSSDDSKDSIEKIIIDTEFIFATAIDNEIPIKGAIAFGEMTIDIENSLYFGKPLIDAYELHKDLEIYGVVFHHTAQERFEMERKHLLDELVVDDYNVPIKSKNITHHLLDWTMFSKNPEDSVKNLYNSVSGSTRLYVDNTLEFIRWVSKRAAELKEKEKQTKK